MTPSCPVDSPSIARPPEPATQRPSGSDRSDPPGSLIVTTLAPVLAPALGPVLAAVLAVALALVLALSAGGAYGQTGHPALSQFDVAEVARIERFEAAFRPAWQVRGQPAVRWTLQQRMAHWQVPGVSVAVIRNGRLAWARGYGVLQAGGNEPVTPDTVFSVGSVSKVGAASTVLRLVQAGRLDLDRDVNSYLKTWQLPATPLMAIRPVTLRGILSHTAGLSVSVFPDFQPGEPLPTTLDVLEGRKPAKTEPVRVVYPPGSRAQYSGGGTMLAQLIIEETTGLAFADAARRHLLGPLGMARSSYQNPLPENHGNIAKAHGPDGQPRALPRGYEAMPEAAASGLWSTPSDYAKLVIALIDAWQGRAGDFLSSALVRQMMTEVGPSDTGLGPVLEGQGLDRRFSHSGGNDSYRAWMEGHLATGNGVIIFTNATRGDPLFREIRRAVAESEGWSAALAWHTEAPDLALTAAEVAELAGVYVATASLSRGGIAVRQDDEPGYQFVARGNQLHLRARWGEDRLLPLVVLDNTHFLSPGDDTVFEFLRDYDGRFSAVQLVEHDGQRLRAPRVAPSSGLDHLPVDSSR